MTNKQIEYVYELFQLKALKYSRGENVLREEKEIRSILHYEVATNGCMNFAVANEKMKMVLEELENANAHGATPNATLINSYIGG